MPLGKCLTDKRATVGRPRTASRRRRFRDTGFPVLVAARQPAHTRSRDWLCSSPTVTFNPSWTQCPSPARPGLFAGRLVAQGSAGSAARRWSAAWPLPPRTRLLTNRPQHSTIEAPQATQPGDAGFLNTSRPERTHVSVTPGTAAPVTPRQQCGKQSREPEPFAESVKSATASPRTDNPPHRKQQTTR